MTLALPSGHLWPDDGRRLGDVSSASKEIGVRAQLCFAGGKPGDGYTVLRELVNLHQRIYERDRPLLPRRLERAAALLGRDSAHPDFCSVRYAMARADVLAGMATEDGYACANELLLLGSEVLDELCALGAIGLTRTTANEALQGDEAPPEDRRALGDPGTAPDGDLGPAPLRARLEQELPLVEERLRQLAQHPRLGSGSRVVHLLRTRLARARWLASHGDLDGLRSGLALLRGVARDALDHQRCLDGLRAA